MICTHVDDLLFCHNDVGKKKVQEILDKFSVGKIEEKNFRYCGRRFIQEEDFTIHVDVQENTRSLKTVTIGHGRKGTDLLTSEELTSLRSVVGSVAWIARYARPDLAYKVNELQRACNPKGTVQSLKDANRVVELALQLIDFKLTFRSQWLDWKDLVVVTFSDASFAGESGYKSQQGRIHYITDSHGMTTGNHKFHLISFASSTMKRVCRATLQAESYALQSAVEAGDRLRAVVCEMTGRLFMSRVDMPRWHELSQKSMLHVYYSDCRSLTDHLQCEQVRKAQDKRFGIELAALRQGIWVDGVLTCEAYKPHGDKIEWIDTGRQLADCLTKSMKPDYLVRVLVNGKMVVFEEKS